MKECKHDEMNCVVLYHDELCPLCVLSKELHEIMIEKNNLIKNKVIFTSEITYREEDECNY